MALEKQLPVQAKAWSIFQFIKPKYHNLKAATVSKHALSFVASYLKKHRGRLFWSDHF